MSDAGLSPRNWSLFDNKLTWDLFGKQIDRDLKLNCKENGLFPKIML